eukprot:TRINITY_DN108872_c0_g1_i1.p1 TRINITY_DN108872_c0_g1~~TRINITY_DN108872_c0_g1_i1.p1  ORF type:complete len:115 (+),score=13.63 TRINITY_DN108872_c0_g1_i1:103-447(+)
MVSLLSRVASDSILSLLIFVFQQSSAATAALLLSDCRSRFCLTPCISSGPVKDKTKEGVIDFELKSHSLRRSANMSAKENDLRFYNTKTRIRFRKHRADMEGVQAASGHMGQDR